MSERERGRVGGGEERGINKREVTELRGTGGQFSSTQRGQSRGHWPFPPFLSLCPPPSHRVPCSLALCLTRCQPLSLPPPLSYASFLGPSLPLFFHRLNLLFPSPFLCRPFLLSLFSQHPHGPLSYPTPFSLPLIFHFLCPVLPLRVHWIVMWGAAELLTKHKAFHIHPAPGIPGYRSVCESVCACMWKTQWEKDEKKSHNWAECCSVHFCFLHKSQVEVSIPVLTGLSASNPSNSAKIIVRKYISCTSLLSLFVQCQRRSQRCYPAPCSSMLCNAEAQTAVAFSPPPQQTIHIWISFKILPWYHI